MERDTNIGGSRIQQELRQSAERLTALCDTAYGHLTATSQESQRELRQIVEASADRIVRLQDRSLAALYRKKETMLQKLQLSQQNTACELQEIAAGLQEELQQFSAQETTRIQEVAQKTVRDLHGAVEGCEAAMVALNEKALQLKDMHKGQASPNLSYSDSRTQSHILSFNKQIEEAEQQISGTVAERAAQRDDLINRLNELLRRRENPCRTGNLEDSLEKGDVDNDLILSVKNELRVEVGRLAQSLRKGHQTSLSQIIQDTRMEATRLSADHHSKMLVICNQLTTARAVVEEEFSNRIQQSVTRAEELIAAERASLQSLCSAQALQVEEKIFQETNRRMMATRTSASELATVIGKRLYEAFSRKVYEHVNHLDKRQKELCNQLEALSVQFSEQLTELANAIDTELDVIKQENDLVERETENWVTAMSFYRESLASERTGG